MQEEAANSAIATLIASLSHHLQEPTPDFPAIRHLVSAIVEYVQLGPPLEGSSRLWTC